MQPSLLERTLILYARHFPVRRGKLRVIDTLWRTAAGGQGTDRTAHLKFGQFMMPCDLSETLQRQFYFFGTYFLEDEIVRVWQTLAKGAGVVFDIGANAGIYSLAALAVEPRAVVHAFEPTPEIAQRLRKTAAMNALSSLQVHELAISDEGGRAILTRWRGDDGANEGMNYLGAPENAALEQLKVNTVRLDDFCESNRIGRIDLLKLDIQGHEHAALLGAETLIRSGRIGKVLMELNWGTGRPGDCAASLSVKLLEDAGYRFAAPRSPLSWRAAGDWMRSLSDVVAFQDALSVGS